MGWLIFIANFFWIVAYDTQYAMADREDDLKIGVKSTAILFGKYDNLIVGLCHVVSLILLSIIGYHYFLGWQFYLGLALAGCFAIFQQWLCAGYDRERCFQAFRNNIWFGAMVFCGIVLGLLDIS